ncbi:beta-d-glucosyl crocetin beta-1 6-glucosyltransferase [Phtheirospermum japonicum]|uniref:Beta-d-glucosyl crocetin beta-1 6-glucosyltransferase n=1 Tax=Phtheirospermum japonicum TaxID=374723 RepID=A0A830BT73_9LAMI|nr:beta-d-glucosyl crocetin beta-1 6-glucosyltransferase [Phtheirospermum japonicum]
MFPWLAHGHIFPYLELAKQTLSRKKFHVYFCSTAINFPSINSFIEKTSLANSIDLVQLHLQPSIELPPHYHTTKNLPSKLSFTLLKSFQTAKPSFSNIIDTIKPDLVIYDVFQPWAAEISSSRNIPAVHFAAFGAATTSFFHHHCVSRDDDNKFPFSTALCLKDQERKTVDDLIEFSYKLSTDAIVLLKTCRGFEGKYIDYVSDACGTKIVPVGPLVTDVCENAEESSEYVMKWLSKKNTCSTVYISFGSEYFLCKEEIDEIAKGLELCDVDFIWVIRFPVEEKEISVEEALPEGFLDRVRDRGIVVSGWAPQANILAHRNTGAFISHCGWSSITESVYFGVPVIGMPMKLNMLIDARMLVDAGACVEVNREGNGVYMGDEIANAINKVIVGEMGKEIRRRARELSEKMRTEEERALDETAEELWRICLKNKK